MRVLGIETSCDDTGVALLENGRLLAERTVTQEAHRRYQGVVPEIASREHLELIFPLIHEVLGEAKLTLRDLDGIAVTCGPGLIGCLLVGLSTAKALAFSLGIPFVGVNHIHAHLLSVCLEHDVTFPLLGMVVSGGHTEILRAVDPDHITPLGSTLDDAAGEAFDKVAKLLGLGYPGGVEIDRLAANGDREFVRFPRAMLAQDSLDVSFSGLKTAVKNFVERSGGLSDDRFRRDVSASFQTAVVDVLVAKMERALARHHAESLILAGGVASNSELRQRFTVLAAERSLPLLMPEPRLCGDNGVMIALVGGRLLSRGESSSFGLGAYPTLEAIEASGPLGSVAHNRQ